MCSLLSNNRRLHSKTGAGQGLPPVAEANSYSTRKLPATRASVLSEDNLYQVVHPKGTRSRSRSKSPFPPSSTPARVGCGEIQHYAEGFGDTKGLTKNLQQEGYMTMGSCAAMLSLPGDVPVKINVVDSDAECK